MQGSNLEEGMCVKMAKQQTQQQVPLLQPITDWYQGKNCINHDVQGRFDRLMQEKKRYVTTPGRTDMEIAWKLLIGTHQNRLHNVKARPYRDKAVKKLANDKTWTKLSQFSTFEDLFDYMKQLLTMNYIGQVTIYDVCLRMTKCFEPSLSPKDYVYVHATVYDALVQLQKKGMFNKTVSLKNNSRISITHFAQLFGNLDSCYIEDILCCIGKQVRNYKAQQQPASKLDMELYNLLFQLKIIP